MKIVDAEKINKEALGLLMQGKILMWRMLAMFKIIKNEPHQRNNHPKIDRRFDRPGYCPHYPFDGL